MIENMRKYTGLMVVVLVLLAAGLILTMGDFTPNTGGRGKVTEVYGENIDLVQFKKMGRNSIAVIKELKDSGLTNYATDMIFNANGNRQAMIGFYWMNISPQNEKEFVTKRIVIAKTAAEYGIYPSVEQAKKHIKERIFVQDGNFDAERYTKFMKNIGDTGLQEEDFVNLVAEALVYSRLKNLISGGLQTPNSLTHRAIQFEQQTLDLTTIAIDIDHYKKDINPTEQEIKTYWEENDFNYLRDRKIRISYLVEKPVYSTPRPVAPVRAPEATDEEFNTLDEAYQKALAKWEIEVEKPADNLVAAKLDDLAHKVDSSDGLKFEEEVANAKLKFTSTELFSANNVPDDLKLLNTKDGDAISAQIFQTKISKSAKFRIPAPIKLEGNGYFYVRFDEEVNPVVKTYEEAKELAKADYIHEKAHAAMLEDAENVKEKLAKLIASGTSAEEAAKINNLKVSVRTGVTISNLSREQGRLTSSEAGIFKNGMITDNKAFSENDVIEKNQITLVYLNKREVIDTAEAEGTRISQQQGRSYQLQNSVFRAWMDEAVTKANIPPMKEN